ncbi:MAG TPA: transcription antitermination factor NusB [Gaiellaceae bacterium]|jgi:16S rRNA (cytosine967-C5)-methyltransferase|nr:transcription antitermination factor NusB [Gaiellaceae bacterium]
MSASPARSVAHKVLVRVFDEGAYADRAFAGEAAGLDARDRAFAQRVAYGAIQRVRTLDHALEAIGGRPVAALDVPVRAALRLGAYELAFLGGVPPRASVNEAVELARASGAGRATGLVNAVLRRVSEQVRKLLDALPASTPQEAALKHSYPDWVAETWWREWGAGEALELMRFQNEPAETAVRVVGTGEARVVERIEPDWLERGLVWPQSRGSQVAGLSVGAAAGERVLDLCAAPGGKATQLAERAGEVVAVELHPGRARELEENAQRLGAHNVTVVNADARELPADLTGFDRALVDAPCSGLGVLASRPDLRWRAQPLPELQLELLRVAAERVRPGGAITYSVCTIAAAENEQVVEASGLEVEPLGELWPEFAHPRRPEFLLTLPHKHHTSGFFIARLRP